MQLTPSAKCANAAERLRPGADAELAAAIADIERRIATLARTDRRVLRPYAVKDL